MKLYRNNNSIFQNAEKFASNVLKIESKLSISITLINQTINIKFIFIAIIVIPKISVRQKMKTPIFWCLTKLALLFAENFAYKLNLLDWSQCITHLCNCKSVFRIQLWTSLQSLNFVSYIVSGHIGLVPCNDYYIFQLIW